MAAPKLVQTQGAVMGRVQTKGAVMGWVQTKGAVMGLVHTKVAVMGWVESWQQGRKRLERSLHVWICLWYLTSLKEKVKTSSTTKEYSYSNSNTVSQPQTNIASLHSSVCMHVCTSWCIQTTSIGNWNHLAAAHLCHRHVMPLIGHLPILIKYMFKWSKRQCSQRWVNWIPERNTWRSCLIQVYILHTH